MPASSLSMSWSTTPLPGLSTALWMWKPVAEPLTTRVDLPVIRLESAMVTRVLLSPTASTPKRSPVISHPSTISARAAPIMPRTSRG